MSHKKHLTFEEFIKHVAEVTEENERLELQRKLLLTPEKTAKIAVWQQEIDSIKVIFSNWPKFDYTKSKPTMVNGKKFGEYVSRMRELESFIFDATRTPAEIEKSEEILETWSRIWNELKF